MKDITYSSSFRGFIRYPSPIDLPVIEDDESIETRELVKEEAGNLAPSKPRLPFCDSLFVIQKEDTKKGFLLRGIPINTTASKEESASKLLFLKSSIGNRLVGSPMHLLLNNTTRGMFFLEYGEKRPLKNPTSERLVTTPTALKDISKALLLEGIPVALRSNLEKII